MSEREPMVPARLLDDVRISMETLRQGHVAAWAEADRLQARVEKLEKAISRAHGLMVQGRSDEARVKLAVAVDLYGKHLRCVRESS